VALLNTALIYCADHELNVSTFAARVVASAEASPYATVLAGLSALQGYKHGGFTERVDVFLREVGTAENAYQTIAKRMKRGEAIPGFGHPLYPDGDPRGRELLAQITAVFPHSPVIQLTDEVCRIMNESVGLKPTIDFALVTLAWAAELPVYAPLALFAIGRTAGWIGHIIEQYAQEQLVRPRAKYVGRRP
jgi:citrate synthase